MRNLIETYLDIIDWNITFGGSPPLWRILYAILILILAILLAVALSTYLPEYITQIIRNLDKRSRKKISKKKYSDDTLFDKLKNWRLERSRELNVKAFQIFSDKTLIEISQTGPTTKEELYDIHGMGPAKVRRFGEEILKVVFENGLS